jgi:sugar phosphate isomerase/epimerase
VNISLILDECTHDPFTAMELGGRWGIRHFEIRFAYRWRLPEGPAWAGDLAVAAAKAYGATITAISPGLFKPVMRLDGSREPLTTETSAEIRRHIDALLPRFFEFAGRLGTRNVLVFALPKPAGTTGKVPAVVIDSLGEAANTAAKAGFQLLLENGQGSWADTGRATRGIVEAVGSPALRVTWDPANVVYGGFAEEPVTEGYPLVAPYVGNVHVKDAVCQAGKGKWVMLGEGRLNWAGQIAALQADDYQGCLTVEPHLQYESPVGLVAKTETFLARLRAIMQTAKGA